MMNFGNINVGMEALSRIAKGFNSRKPINAGLNTNERTDFQISFHYMVINSQANYYATIPLVQGQAGYLIYINHFEWVNIFGNAGIAYSIGFPSEINYNGMNYPGHGVPALFWEGRVPATAGDGYSIGFTREYKPYTLADGQSLWLYPSTVYSPGGSGDSLVQVDGYLLRNPQAA